MILNINIELLFLIILIILILFNIIYLIYQIIKNKKVNKINKELINKNIILNNNTRYNFTSDSDFLIFLISYKIKIYNELIINPYMESNKLMMLKDKDLNEAVESIVIDVKESMNEDYINVLLKYFTKDGLDTYITEMVLNYMTMDINEKNKIKIKSFNRVDPNKFEVKKKDIDDEK